VLQRARDAAKKAVCIGNLRQLHLAYLGYVEDNNDYGPLYRDYTTAWNNTYTYWPIVMLPYLGYQKSITTYINATTKQGQWEIRNGYSYKTFSDTSTKQPSVFFCPSTRGPPNGSAGNPYGGAGHAGVWVDYGYNSVMGGIYTNTGPDTTWPPVPIHSARQTTPQKLVIFADAVFNVLRNTYPSNRHTGKTKDAMGPGYALGSGTAHMVFLDGHVESATTDASNFRNSTGNEAQFPAFKYFLTGN
jgi:prepilin-type processing-associated H-X9-DG protein